MGNGQRAALKREKLELLSLDNQLCFAFYAATRAIAKAYREYLEPMGLTYPQYLVLIVLWEHDGLTISEIGSYLKLDSGTLTPLVKRLEAMGLVVRRRGIEDEREVIVNVTEAGLALQGSAYEARLNVAKRLGMSEKQIMALRADVMGVIDRLEEAERGD